jgi:hypothetical protein
MRHFHDEKKTLASSILRLAPAAKDRRDVVKALSKVGGVDFSGGYRGTVALGGAVAELELAADSGIRIRADFPLPLSPANALEATSTFPGNLRFARDRGCGELVADTLVDGEAHLPHTLGAIRGAITRALKGEIGPEDDLSALPADRDVVRKALTDLPWAKDGVVEQDNSWELRPRLRGEAVPVAMALVSGGLCLSRTVLHCLPEASTTAARAVSDQAVRINARLRHARLAVRNGRLIAEARLGPGQVRSDWLDSTARAVAVTARHAVTPLRLLASQAAVANTYVAIFCSHGEKPAPRGVGS